MNKPREPLTLVALGVALAALIGVICLTYRAIAAEGLCRIEYQIIEDRLDHHLPR